MENQEEVNAAQRSDRVRSIFDSDNESDDNGGQISAKNLHEKIDAVCYSLGDEDVNVYDASAITASDFVVHIEEAPIIKSTADNGSTLITPEISEGTIDKATGKSSSNSCSIEKIDNTMVNPISSEVNISSQLNFEGQLVSSNPDVISETIGLVEEEIDSAEVSSSKFVVIGDGDITDRASLESFGGLISENVSVSLEKDNSTGNEVIQNLESILTVDPESMKLLIGGNEAICESSNNELIFPESEMVTMEVDVDTVRIETHETETELEHKPVDFDMLHAKLSNGSEVAILNANNEDMNDINKFDIDANKLEIDSETIVETSAADVDEDTNKSDKVEDILLSMSKMEYNSPILPKYTDYSTDYQKNIVLSSNNQSKYVTDENGSTKVDNINDTLPSSVWDAKLDSNVGWDQVDDEILFGPIKDGAQNYENKNKRKIESPDKFETEPHAKKVKYSGPASASGKRKQTAKRKKSEKSFDFSAIMLAFERGWVREVLQTKVMSTNKIRTEVYYYAPNKEKLSSFLEIGDYMIKHGIDDLSCENFVFAKEPIGLDPKYEKIIEVEEHPIKESRPESKKVANQSLKKQSPKEPSKKIPEPKKPVTRASKTTSAAANTEKVAYATHLHPSVTPLTPVRILTPLIGGASKLKSIQCSEACDLSEVPSLKCIKCNKMFHSECCQMPKETLPLIVSGVAKFLCPNCYKEETPSTHFIPAEPYEPLAFDPSSDSEDEGLVSDFEHPSYTRFTTVLNSPPRHSSSASSVDRHAHDISASMIIEQLKAQNTLHQPSILNSSNDQQGSLVTRTAAPGHSLPASNRGNLFLYQPIFPERHDLSKNVYLPFTGPTDVGKNTFKPVVVQQNLAVPVRNDDDAAKNYLADSSVSYGVLRRIFSYLGVIDLANASKVSHMWRDLARNPCYWQNVSLRNVTIKNWPKFVAHLKERSTKSIDFCDMKYEVSDEKELEKNEAVEKGRKRSEADKLSSIKMNGEEFFSTVSAEKQRKTCDLISYTVFSLKSVDKLVVGDCNGLVLEKIVAACCSGVTSLVFTNLNSFSTTDKCVKINLTGLERIKSLKELTLISSSEFEITPNFDFSQLKNLEYLTLKRFKVNKCPKFSLKLKKLDILVAEKLTTDFWANVAALKHLVTLKVEGKDEKYDKEVAEFMKFLSLKNS